MKNVVLYCLNNSVEEKHFNLPEIEMLQFDLLK